MITLEECRRFAADCEQLADITREVSARAQYLELAQTWRNIAECQAACEQEPE